MVQSPVASPKQVPLGTAGMILVLVSFLAFFNQREQWWARSLPELLDVSGGELIGWGKMDNLALFAICFLAGVLGIAGLVMCIAAIIKRSQAVLGVVGILAFLAKTAIILVRHLPPSNH